MRSSSAEEGLLTASAAEYQVSKRLTVKISLAVDLLTLQASSAGVYAPGFAPLLKMVLSEGCRTENKSPQEAQARLDFG